MTQEEWHGEGERLFGPDESCWRFVCPICGNVQSPEDFRQYKDSGAEPGSAYKQCLGRYLPGAYSAFGPGKRTGPCDYAAYGLIRLGPIRVEDVPFPIFDFDRSEAAGRAM